MKRIILIIVILGITLEGKAQDETINGNLTLSGGTAGTSKKIIFKTSDNPDLSKYIGTENYWTIIGANGNEGWKFKDNTGDVLMQINGLGNNNGYVGIGTSTPNSLLDVSGKISFSSSLYKTTTSPGSSDPSLLGAHSEHGDVAGGGELSIISLGYEQGISGGTDMDTKIWSYARNLTESRNFITIGRNRIDLSAQNIYTNGTVGIGTTNTFGYQLAVNGTIGSTEVKVENTSAWPDFVFMKDYELRTLEEVEKHIIEKGHLPEIPSEDEVTENGINLGEMNAKLLQKIEELTLYMIDMNKQMKCQSERMEQLEQENSELKKEVSALKDE